MRGFPAPWWVAGGWALDLFAGSAREHDDVDVLVLRDDQRLIRDHLGGWDVQVAHAGRLEPWTGERIDPPRGGLWARSDVNGPWELDFLLADSDGSDWLFKRDQSLRLPLGEIGMVGEAGVPYLRPELVLLFKSRLDRERDAEDFDRTLPKLDQARRALLAQWLPGDHPWRPRLT
jgi:hypothetical protein